VLVIGRGEVEELLDVDELIEALAGAMADLSSGRATAPNRIGVFVQEHDAVLAAMPARLPSAGALATKLVTVFPRNAGTGTSTHQAVIVVFDQQDGRPVALLDGTAITSMRTAAGSALATRLLARDDATTLAVLGTGEQARSHVQAVTRVRPFAEVRIAGRDPEKARRLAEELGVVAAASFAEACAGADVVCATTHATDPVVRRELLDPGTHVTSVGYNVHGREVDEATVADALVAVESRATALAAPPAGATEITDERQIHAEIGELVTGAVPGRTSPDGITLYKSVGVAVQDAAAAALVLAAARERGAGTEISL
jgi:alanine dehydrogenase